MPPAAVQMKRMLVTARRLAYADDLPRLVDGVGAAIRPPNVPRSTIPPPAVHRNA